MLSAMSRARLVLTGLLTLGGCSCDDAPRAQRPLHPIEVPEAVLDPILFDERGRLRASGTKAWDVELPVGFEVVARDETRTVLDGEVPIAAVHAFYRSRLVSSGITEHGEWLGFAYAQAATGQLLSSERYDVTIAPMRHLVRVEIARRVAETPAIPEAERIRRITEAARAQARD